MRVATADEVYQLRKKIGERDGRLCFQSDFARLLGISRRTVIRWEQHGIGWRTDYTITSRFNRLRRDVDG